MIIGGLKHELNVWQFSFLVQTRPPDRFGFHPLISIWLIKLHALPPEGAVLERKKHYTGIHFNLKLPIPYVYEWKWMKPIAVLIKWDKKPVPRWVPKWIYDTILMKPWCIDLLTRRFRYPSKLKFY